MAKTRIDVHCHILPGIDDGAKNTDASIELLRESKKQGVSRFVFTPHFDSDRITIDDFCQRREDSVNRLASRSEFKELEIEYKLGAEIYYTVSLGELNLDKLCFTGTDYVLVELPTQVRPHGMKRTFGNIIRNGYTPIIAHVERYGYILSKPSELYDLIDMGCLAHINAETVCRKTKGLSMVNYLIRHDLVHFMCSDCHSIDRRPPNLKKGFEAVRSQLGEKYCDRFLDNVNSVWNGERVEPEYIRKPINFLGMWI